jgi:PAS domain S-box-containing protein
VSSRSRRGQADHGRGDLPRTAASEPLAAARLSRVLELTHTVLIETDRRGRTTHVSVGLEAVVGFSAEELIGADTLQFVHPDDRAPLTEAFARARDGGESIHCVHRGIHKSGHWVWLEATLGLHPLRSAEGAMLVLLRDVSEVVAVADALRVSQDRFDALTHDASDLIVELDSDGRFLFVSDNCEHIMGRRPEDLVGRSIGEFAESGRVHPGDRGAMLGGFAETVATGRRSGRRLGRFLLADGAWHWFESQFTTYQGRHGEWRSIAICRDISERLRAQEELRESEERYRLITDTAHEIISEVDTEGRVTYVSPAVEQVLGYRPEELVGTTPVMMLHPDEVERAVESLLTGIRTGQPMRTEPYRARHKDGSWRWLESEGLIYTRADGEVRFLMVGRDVTDRIRAQEERIAFDARMRQAQRLEGLGVMAGGIAHDFNNLLTPILGDATLALLDLPADSPVRARVERIQRAARRAAALTHQMLAYAGKGPLLVELLDLTHLVREMAQLLESSVARRAELVYELDETLPPIEGDAAQISQVVMNVIINAAEAVADGGGRIEIRTGSLVRHGPPPPDWIGEELPPGPAVYFEVVDDGCGMPPETLARIFDPFFTTKFTGRGLGLAAAVGIVRGHGGAIEIETDPGRGTRFRVMFPASGRRETSSAAAAAEIASWKAEGTVLVVDADEGVRDLVAETLERAGLRVLHAADAATAVELFERHADAIDLVILDRGLRAARGEELFDAIRRLRPAAPILLVSGYSEERAAAPLAGKELAGFLQKPFLPERLLERVRAALEA